MNQPMLIAIAGPPLAGKTTLGKNLAATLGIHYCDSDELRAAAFGVPTHEEYAKRWKNPTEAALITRKDMTLAYRLLHETVNLSLEADRSLIISATYASKSSQEFLLELVRTQEARLRFIICRVEQETDEELKRRMRQRDEGKKFVYGTQTLIDYYHVKGRFEWPHKTGVFSPDDLLIIDTSQSVERCVNLSLNFIHG
ncbi:MAG: AAA family ATPase [Candidatus Jorgensenbacteria bacterium]|nr:AAA family ATPase [Candidatus Jorgensenbacteria bacterium]